MIPYAVTIYLPNGEEKRFYLEEAEEALKARYADEFNFEGAKAVDKISMDYEVDLVDIYWRKNKRAISYIYKNVSYETLFLV